MRSTTGSCIGSTSRCRLRKEGVPVGLLRPITLFPFPSAQVGAIAWDVDALLVIEMNTGQMVEDVRASTTMHDLAASPGTTATR